MKGPCNYIEIVRVPSAPPGVTVGRTKSFLRSFSGGTGNLYSTVTLPASMTILFTESRATKHWYIGHYRLAENIQRSPRKSGNSTAQTGPTSISQSVARAKSSASGAVKPGTIM